jgi:hypothetical protein
MRFYSLEDCHIQINIVALILRNAKIPLRYLKGRMIEYIHQHDGQYARLPPEIPRRFPE